MILIADSGSTKTDWRILDGDEIIQVKSDGINPNYMKPLEIQKSIELGLSDFLDKPIENVFFYGSGCGADENKEIVRKAISPLFPNAKIEVNTDMLAAARALCGKEEGIACILGTGSNSCLYDGEQITGQEASLGYILGDLGSGNQLGKRLLTHFVKGELPEKVKENFDKRFSMSESEVIQELYKSETPVQFLAGFSKFVFQNIKQPFLYKMVYAAFSEFIEINIKQYKEYQDTPIHFTGSVAFYFNNILRQVGTDQGVNIKHIVEGPIAGLVLYHQKK